LHPFFGGKERVPPRKPPLAFRVPTEVRIPSRSVCSRGRHELAHPGARTACRPKSVTKRPARQRNDGVLKPKTSHSKSTNLSFRRSVATEKSYGAFSVVLEGRASARPHLRRDVGDRHITHILRLLPLKPGLHIVNELILQFNRREDFDPRKPAFQDVSYFLKIAYHE